MKELREYRKLSRYRIAKLSRVNEPTLQMIENSENPNPTSQVMCKIADALELSLDDLRKE